MSLKLDYSELVTALQDNKLGRANRLLDELRPRLKKYLSVVLEAPPSVADDVIQEAMINTYQKILEGEIEQNKYIYKYLITTCRFAYFRHQYNENLQKFPAEAAKTETGPAQLERLIDQDRQRVLAECIDQLPEDKKEFITYVFEHPSVSGKGLSEYFDISYSNARALKSRIIRALGKCARKKLG